MLQKTVKGNEAAHTDLVQKPSDKVLAARDLANRTNELLARNTEEAKQPRVQVIHMQAGMSLEDVLALLKCGC